MFKDLIELPDYWICVVSLFYSLTDEKCCVMLLSRILYLVWTRVSAEPGLHALLFWSEPLTAGNHPGPRQSNRLPSLPTSNMHFRPLHVLSMNVQWKGLNPLSSPSYGLCVDSTGRPMQLGVFTVPRTSPCVVTLPNCWTTLKISGYYSSSTLIVPRLN